MVPARSGANAQLLAEGPRGEPENGKARRVDISPQLAASVSRRNASSQPASSPSSR